MRLRSVEADLITGLFALDVYAREGVPKILGPMPSPRDTLRRVLDAVSPADVTYPLRVIWKAARELFAAGCALTWESCIAAVPDQSRPDCLSFAERERGPKAIGMGLPYYTPHAARVILRFRAEADTMRDCMDRAAEALENMKAALEGICA